MMDRPDNAEMRKRWEQHKASGGQLTFEKFCSPEQMKKRRKQAGQKKVNDLKRLPRQDKIAMASEMFGELSDGAFFAAAEQTFGLSVTDFAKGE